MSCFPHYPCTYFSDIGGSKINSEQHQKERNIEHKYKSWKSRKNLLKVSCNSLYGYGFMNSKQ